MRSAIWLKAKVKQDEALDVRRGSVKYRSDRISERQTPVGRGRIPPGRQTDLPFRRPDRLQKSRTHRIGADREPVEWWVGGTDRNDHPYAVRLSLSIVFPGFRTHTTVVLVFWACPPLFVRYGKVVVQPGTICLDDKRIVVCRVVFYPIPSPLDAGSAVRSKYPFIATIKKNKAQILEAFATKVANFNSNWPNIEGILARPRYEAAGGFLIKGLSVQHDRSWTGSRERRGPVNRASGYQPKEDRDRP